MVYNENKPMIPSTAYDYEFEIVGYDIIPVLAWRKTLRMEAGEAQLIALLGALGFVATWFI
jgi:hypothetical protein